MEMEENKPCRNGPYRPGTQEYFAQIAEVVHALSIAGMEVLRETREAKRQLLEEQRLKKLAEPPDEPNEQKEKKCRPKKGTGSKKHKKRNASVRDQEAGDNAVMYDTSDFGVGISEREVFGKSRGYITDEWDFPTNSHGPVTREVQCDDDFYQGCAGSSRYNLSLFDPFANPQPSTSAQATLAGSLPWSSVFSEENEEEQLQNETMPLIDQLFLDDSDPDDATNKVTVEDLQLALNTVFKQLSNTEEGACAQDPEDMNNLVFTETQTPHRITPLPRRKPSMPEYGDLDEASGTAKRTSSNRYDLFLPEHDKRDPCHMFDDMRRSERRRRKSKSVDAATTSMSETILRPKTHRPTEIFRYQNSRKSSDDITRDDLSNAGSGEYLPAGEYLVPVRDGFCEPRSFSPTGSTWSLEGPSSLQLDDDELHLNLSDMDSNPVTDDDMVLDFPDADQ